MLKQRRRYLRIGFSGICGILCLLLIALWVRSYWQVDQLDIQVSKSSIIGAAAYGGSLTTYKVNSVPPGYIQGWDYKNFVVDGQLIQESNSANEYHIDLGFGIRLSPTSTVLCIPAWTSILAAISAAVLPWLRWRFSLRTLLIGTTVTAALLGLAVVALRGS